MDSARALLQNKADLTLLNNYGETPLQNAITAGHHDIANMIKLYINEHIYVNGNNSNINEEPKLDKTDSDNLLLILENLSGTVHSIKVTKIYFLIHFFLNSFL